MPNEYQGGSKRRQGAGDKVSGGHEPRTLPAGVAGLGSPAQGAGATQQQAGGDNSPSTLSGSEATRGTNSFTQQQRDASSSGLERHAQRGEPIKPQQQSTGGGQVGGDSVRGHDEEPRSESTLGHDVQDWGILREEDGDDSMSGSVR